MKFQKIHYHMILIHLENPFFDFIEDQIYFSYLQMRLRKKIEILGTDLKKSSELSPITIF